MIDRRFSVSVSRENIPLWRRCYILWDETHKTTHYTDELKKENSFYRAVLYVCYICYLILFLILWIFANRTLLCQHLHIYNTFMIQKNLWVWIWKSVWMTTVEYLECLLYTIEPWEFLFIFASLIYSISLEYSRITLYLQI